MARNIPMPDRHRVQRMVDVALPGGRVTSIRRLRGGLGAYVHAIGVSFAGGARTTVVLRRRGEHGHLSTPEAATIELQTLAILDKAGVPVPQPLLLDADGIYFDGPSIVMSYEGRPMVSPRATMPWLSDLAGALTKVRAVTPDRFDLTFLETRTDDATRRRATRPLHHSIAEDPFAHQIAEYLRQHVSSISSVAPCVVHRDFWPGNTVWRRGRLSAIVDWSTAVVGDPRIDIAQCRIDLAMMHGADMAGAFLDVLCTLTGGPIPDIWFFDLLIGIDDALGTFRSWIPGYHDLGLAQLTDEVVEERLRTFLAQSLRRAEDGGVG
jgi:aminoglycoside phosphotransferase (APT) family kinase protein